MGTDLNSIRSTVETLLADELRSVPVIPVVFHNMSYRPEGASPWVQCLTSFGTAEYIDMGPATTGSNRTVGLATFNIFTVDGAGPGPNYDIGNRIRSLYNRVIVSGIRFDAPIGPEVLGSPSPEGFFQTQVRVTFEHFEES